MKFLLRWLGCSVGVAVAVWLVPGVSAFGTSEWLPFLATALFLALINASIKPIMKLLSLPITIITLGVFALVLNAILLELAAWLATSFLGTGIVIDSFSSAFFAAIIISIASSFMNSITGADD